MVTQAGRCATCFWWSPTPENAYGCFAQMVDGWGECRRFYPARTAGAEPPYGPPTDRGAFPYCSDEGGWVGAEFYTRPDFGCTEWQERAHTTNPHEPTLNPTISP